MKTTKRLLAAVLLLSVLLTGLSACDDKLSGTYTADVFGTGMAYTFSGNKVTLHVTALGAVIATLDGTYEIDDGKITLTFTGDGESAKEYSGTFDYAADEDGDSIKIGVVEYEREDG